MAKKLLIFPSQIKKIEKRAEELNESESFVVREAIDQYFGLKTKKSIKPKTKEKIIIKNKEVEDILELLEQCVKIGLLPTTYGQILIKQFVVYLDTTSESMKHEALETILDFIKRNKLMGSLKKVDEIGDFLDKIKSNIDKK